MSEVVWVSILLVVVWASLPISVIVSAAKFDQDVVKPGEKAGDH